MSTTDALAAILKLRKVLDTRVALGTTLEILTKEDLEALPPALQTAILRAAVSEFRMWGVLHKAMKSYTCTCPMSLRERDEHSMLCPLYNTTPQQ